MNFSAPFIHRPAFTIVISLILVMIGILSFVYLPVRFIPNINPPALTITTMYPGANASLVEHDVTKVIEEGLSGLNGMEELTSKSRQNSSEVSIKFRLGYNMDTATEEVRANIERIRGALPKDSENPIVSKVDLNNEPILYISFKDNNRSALALGDYIEQYVVPLFDTIDGVGRIDFYGKRVSAVQIKLDPARMAAASVTVDEVTQLLQEQNATIPSGQIRGADRYYSVLTDTTLKSIDQFNDLIIRDDQNQMIRLKDVGIAKVEAEDEDSAFRINGKPAIALGIVPQSTANPLMVEEAVKKKFAQLKKSLPHTMQASIIYNQVDTIRDSIHSVYKSFLEAIIFVWLVIFVFLFSFRATFIPLITIPVCLISTFSLLYLLNFSINVITLMAFVLAIGLVVDDAIIMLENINRYMQKGYHNIEAALKGSREMIFPIIATTLTLTAVYLPIAFTPGLLGVLFREFTFTLAGAVLISGFVALTLSPMMCAYLLKPISDANFYQKWVMQKLDYLQNQYQYLLILLLKKRKWVVMGLLLIGLMGIFIYHLTPALLAPEEDKGEINVYVMSPRSASFQYADTYTHQLEKIYEAIPDIDSYLTASSTYSVAHAWQILTLKKPNLRKHSTQEIVDLITEKSNTILGARVHVSMPPPPLAQFAGDDSSGNNIGLVMMTSNDYRQLQQTSQTMVEAIKQTGLFTHVDNGLKWDSTQFQINVDRDKAADLKVSLPAITSTISTYIAGRNVGKMNDANIIVQMQKNNLGDPNVFQQLYVKNKENTMIPLTNLVTIAEVSSPEIFSHFERLRADRIIMSLAPKVRLTDGIDQLQSIAKNILPDYIKFTFTGEAKGFLDSTGKTLFTFLLALVFIYLVLVAQFESFIDPLIIILTVPFAVVGAILSLKIFGGSINVYSNIGLITLIGLIAKHGILITEFANQLQDSGKSLNDAIIEAAMLRLRPILMTTAAMVLGALPLALAFGVGAESRQQIGLVISGGLFFGTFFSLIVVPIAYTYLSPFRKRRI